MADLLREQNGLICRDQALVAGVPRIKIDGHVRHGRWQRVLPAVYLTEPSINGQEPTPSWRQRIRAAWMWAGDDAVIIGPAAAAWAGYFNDLPSATPIGVLVPPNRRKSAQPLIRVVRARIDDRAPPAATGS